MREISVNETRNALNIFSALSDNTRIEILGLLLNNENGLTAADISRIINKKIPSTLHQLDILYDCGLITQEMKKVQSIGREIKHWILPKTNYHLILRVELKVLLNENFLSMRYRQKYLELLHYHRNGLDIQDILQFDEGLLRTVFEQLNTKVTEKEITRIIQLSARDLLLDAIMNNIRELLGNLAPKEEGISMDILKEMMNLKSSIIGLVIEECNKYTDIGFDPNGKFIYRVF